MGGSGIFTQVGIALGGAIASGADLTLTLSGSTLTQNQAIGGNGATGGNATYNRVGESMGGGLFNQGVGTVTDCTFLANQALGGARNDPGGGSSYEVNSGQAGAIANFEGQLTVMDSTLANNQAVGGAGVPGQAGGDGRGGGIANVVSGTLTVIDSRLIANQALGANGAAGGNGGNGLGGGLYNEATSQTALMGSQIVNNQAIGGTANSGGTDGQGLGGGVYNDQGGVVTADQDTLITGNSASTSNDDVYGDLGGPAPHHGSSWALAVTGLFGSSPADSDVLGELAGP
jgi:hypothetical protein